jgi:uncharacterized protein (TIGR00299 family) protein
MKILYFDCFSGISGDMTLAALLDLGVDRDWLVGELGKLGVDGWEMAVSETSKQGIGGKQVNVILEKEAHAHTHSHTHEHTGLSGKIHALFHNHGDSPAHVHRDMAGIARLIDGSALSHTVKDLSKRIFMRLAVAEAKVHGTTPEKVHFHEVGAVDSIIDIVGAAICIDFLAPERIYASVLHDGYGFVKCQHGVIPVPVPAVTEVLAARGVNFKQLDIEGEMMTPTGAAIVAELAESFGAMPEMKVIKTGYGAGKKDFPIPNMLRVFMGETDVAIEETDAVKGKLDAVKGKSDAVTLIEATPEQTDAATVLETSPTTDAVTVIETNIDDMTPEILGYVMDKLFEAGARDVFFTPIYMKKCRPATMITILCDEALISDMESILFRETSTIGVRRYRADRSILPRKIVTVITPCGEVKAKETVYAGVVRRSLEYEDACRLAKEKGIALKDIYIN